MVQQLLDEVTERLNILEELPKKVKLELTRLEQEQCDLLHMIELGKFNACEGYKLAKRLQDIRVERREIKNIKENIEKSRSTIDKYKTIRKSLVDTRRAVSETTQTQGARTYTTRVIDGKDDIAKLNSVNKTNMRFKPNNKMSKLDSLFKQIESK